MFDSAIVDKDYKLICLQKKTNVIKSILVYINADRHIEKTTIVEFHFS